MKLGTRRGMFYLSTLMFIVFGAYLVLIAQGYVLDFKTFHVVKTGAIFLDFEPTKDASLLVNGVTKKIGTTFINQGTLVKNLAPGSYHVLLSKPGYASWEKTLDVSSGLVTPRTAIRLFPKDPSSTLIAKSVSSFWLSDKEPAFQNTSGTLIYGKTEFPSLSLVSIRGTSALARSQTSSFSLDLNDASSSLNVIKLFDTLKKRFTPPVTAQAVHMELHPFSSNKVLISTPSALYLLDTKRPSLDRLFLSSSSPIVDFKTTGSDVVINLKTRFVVLNLVFQTLTSYTIPSETARDILPSSDGNTILFLNPNGFLFRYNRDTNLLRAFGEKPSEFLFSPEEKRIAERIGNTIVITYLDPWNNDLRKKPYEKTLLVLPQGTYHSLAWLDSEHLLLLKDRDLFVLEIDDAKPITMSVLARNITSFRVKDSNTLFVLTDNHELWKMDL